MIKFRCSKCNQKIGVGEEHTGKKVKCPKCGSIENTPSIAKSMLSTAQSNQKESSTMQSGAAEKRVLVLGAVLVVVILVAITALLTYRSYASKHAQQRIKQQVELAVSSAEQYSSKFEYDRALQEIATAKDSINSFKYTTYDDKKLLQDKEDELTEAKQSFNKKLASGYIVFENKLILAKEKKHILAERERIKEEKERVAAEEKRRQELALAEKNKERMNAFLTFLGKGGNNSHSSAYELEAMTGTLTHEYKDTFYEDTLPYFVDQTCKAINLQIVGAYVTVTDLNTQAEYKFVHTGDDRITCYKCITNQNDNGKADDVLVNALPFSQYLIVVHITPERAYQHAYKDLPDSEHDKMKTAIENAVMDYVKAQGYQDLCSSCHVFVNIFVL